MRDDIECVLFDLDGVLVDACDWHYYSLNKALDEVVGFQITREDHEQKYNGLPTSVKLSMLGIKDNDKKNIWELKQKYTIDVIKQNSKILVEKIELLSFLKSKNKKIACVTNSIRKTASLMLQHTGQYNLLDLLVTNEDVKNNKPNPECYNFAIKKLNANPNKTICVEDSEKGIEAAKSSLVKHTWIVSGCNEVTLNNYKIFVESI